MPAASYHHLRARCRRHQAPRDPARLPARPGEGLPVHVDFLRLGAGATIRVRIPMHVHNAESCARREARRHRQHRRPTRSRWVCGRRIPDAIDVDVARARDQPFEASERRHAAAERARDLARDPTLVTIVPPSGYAEEMKAAAEAAALPPPLLLPRPAAGCRRRTGAAPPRLRLLLQLRRCARRRCGCQKYVPAGVSFANLPRDAAQAGLSDPARAGVAA